MVRMLGRTENHYWGTVLDCPDAGQLAHFYSRLLGWKIYRDEPGWATIKPEDGVAYLAFQTSPEYVRPVWPPSDGRQQMMLHLDIEVPDLEAAVAQAQSVGAVLADHQPQNDVRVMLDPAGHPFCLYVGDAD
jgi:catechol 2,3-dioxygenase-like lactoylglutathione lyase family enzyme